MKGVLEKDRMDYALPVVLVPVTVLHKCRDLSTGDDAGSATLAAGTGGRAKRTRVKSIMEVRCGWQWGWSKEWVRCQVVLVYWWHTRLCLTFAPTYRQAWRESEIILRRREVANYRGICWGQCFNGTVARNSCVGARAHV